MGETIHHQRRNHYRIHTEAHCDELRRKCVKTMLIFSNVNFKQRKTITMADLLVKLKEKFADADISRRHLTRVVRDNHITLKIARVRHEPNKRFGKDIDINAHIKDFYDEIKKYKREDIILCSPNEDFERRNKRGNPDFRYTFKRFVAQIEYSRP